MRKIYKGIDLCSKAIDRVFLFIGVVLMMILSVSCVAQVFTRYVLNDSLSWTEEVSRYTFVWVSLVGAVLATSTGAHCVVTVVEGLLKGRARDIHRLFVFACILVGSFVMLTQGINIVQATLPVRSTHLKIPMGLVYLAVPVSGFGLFVHTIADIIKVFLGGGKEDEA